MPVLSCPKSLAQKKLAGLEICSTEQNAESSME